jgi:hypothetical protein
MADHMANIASDELSQSGSGRQKRLTNFVVVAQHRTSKQYCLFENKSKHQNDIQCNQLSTTYIFFYF